MDYIKTFKRKNFLITTALMLGLSFQAPATAGNHKTDKSYESYPSVTEMPEDIFKRNGKRHDVSLSISPDAVLNKLQQKQKIILADVRSPKDFARLHIPGSINIPLHAVKTKFVLKSFLIVLINDGFQYSLLATECLKLRNVGFEAFILDGGLYAWYHAGSRLTGDLFVLDKMKTVTPRGLIREKDFQNILMIDISPVQKETSMKVMPSSKHLPVSAEAGVWTRKIERIIASHKNQPFFSILVFNETGDGYGRADKILTGLGLNVFFLQGGVDGYRRYLKDLMLSRQPLDSRIKTSRKCVTCVKEIKKDIIREIRK
jgi:rhodanese-related sulfurtransferase